MSNTKRKSDYPSKVDIRRAAEAARTAGIDIAGMEVFPYSSGGAIQFFDLRAVPQSNANLDEFEKWDAAGKL